MARLFSIHRRRPHLVDLLTPLQYGVGFYRLKWAANFDQSFTTFLNSTNVGYKDPAVSIYSMHPLNVTGSQVRVAFDPTTYGINDDAPFWIQFVQVIGGIEQTPSAPTLVLPESAHRGEGIVVVAGTAPAVAAGSALRLDLPLVQDVRIVNNAGGTNLRVSSDSAGPEFVVAAGQQFTNLQGTQGSFWVRGEGATAAFSMTCTLARKR